MLKSPKEILDAINQTNAEIKALLAKSGVMHKDGGLPEEEGQPEGMEGSPEGMEGGEDQPAPEGMEGQPEGMEGSPEGMEGGEDHAAALQQQVKEMPDEELDQMLEALMAEKEARSAAQGGAPAGGEGQPEPAEKSYGAELAKSMSAMAQAVQTLTKEVQGLKAAKPTTPKVVSKPAATNSIKVLEKSAPQPKRLSKSDTQQYLLGQIRAKNPIVRSVHVAQLNNIHDDETLAQWQDKMTLEGLKFPEVK